MNPELPESTSPPSPPTPQVVEPPESDATKKVKQLYQGRRSKGSGSTLSHDNIKSLVTWYSTLLQSELWRETNKFLSDRYIGSDVLRQHDFELLKAMRNFIQAGNHIQRMIDLRVEELNQLVEDNQELFDRLMKEEKEKLEALRKVEEEQKIEAARVAEQPVPPTDSSVVIGTEP